MPLQPVRWGILGTGRMAAEFAESLSLVPDARLQAIGSRSLDRARGFARRAGAVQAHASYEELAANPEIDVVYVATPNAAHRDHSQLALCAGKPVLCEKPFAMNAEEAREVIELARAKRLFCMDGMWNRFVPLVEKSLAMVREGEIGDPRTLIADFGIRVSGSAGRQLDPALGGGALLDLGVYLVALAHQLFGTPVGVSGEATLAATGVDEQAAIVLRHSGGRVAFLHATLRARTRSEVLVVGSRGQLRIHNPFLRPHTVSIERWPEAEPAPQPATGARGAGRMISRAKRLRVVRAVYLRLRPVARALLPGAGALFDPDEGTGHQHEAAEVMRCLRSGEIESPRMPLDETLAIMRTLDAVRAGWERRSANEGGA